jgi:hypothetical protein
LNKAVSWADLKDTNNISLILKTVSTGKVLLDGFKGNILTHYIKTGTPAAEFQIPKNKFNPIAGQFYKAQIAFVDSNNTTGYFSDVTIVKFTSTPVVGIADLVEGSNSAQYVYTGTYETEDVTEKVYSY